MAITNLALNNRTDKDEQGLPLQQTNTRVIFDAVPYTGVDQASVTHKVTLMGNILFVEVIIYGWGGKVIRDFTENYSISELGIPPEHRTDVEPTPRNGHRRPVKPTEVGSDRPKILTDSLNIHEGLNGFYLYGRMPGHSEDTYLAALGDGVSDDTDADLPLTTEDWDRTRMTVAWWGSAQELAEAYNFVLA